MIDINKSSTYGQPARGILLYILYIYILLYYFINLMIKTLYISSFIVVYFIYFTHKVHVDVFFPSPEKLTFGGRKGIFSHSF